MSDLLVTGIVQVCGGHDVGKTSFALECGARPERIWFADDDIKGRATVSDLRKTGDFGAYHDLVALSEGKREIEFHEAVLDLIDGIEPNEYDAIIFDTWTRFSKTCHPYVLQNPSKFKLKWSPSGKIKGAEQWQEAQWYESQILNRLQELAPLVVLVTHLKDHYMNNAKTGKRIPASSRTLNRVPRFRLWLRHNPDSRVPIGLVLKRLDQKVRTDRGIRTVSVLPRKLTPNVHLPSEDTEPNDQSLWDTIARYYAHPFGNREPLPEETPDAYELSILDGTLTEDQRHTLKLMLKAGAVSHEDEDLDIESSGPADAYPDKLVAAVKRARDEGKPLPTIANDFDLDGPATVVKILNS